MDLAAIGAFAALSTIVVGFVTMAITFRNQALKEGQRIQRLAEVEARVEHLQGRHDELLREHNAVREMTIRQDEKLSAILGILQDVQKDLKSHLRE